MTARVVVGSSQELGGLLRYLDRLLTLDPSAAVRLQSTGSVLGVWGGPPLGVLALRPVALVAAADLDLTVAAQRLREQLDGGVDVALPGPVPGPPWAGLLPPRSGWELVATVPAGSLADSVRVGMEAFRRRVERVHPDLRTQQLLADVAAEVWERPTLGLVPLRGAHAASLLGMLAPEGEVTGLRSGHWWRVSCPGGSVLGRVQDRSGAGLDLLAPSRP